MCILNLRNHTDMTPSKKPSRSRSPRGVDSNRPVYVRLMPAERAQLQQLADDELRAIGTQARLLIIEAMQARAEQANEQDQH